MRNAIEKFQPTSLQKRRRKRGTYTLKDFVNMEQTPLPFAMDDNI